MAIDVITVADLRQQKDNFVSDELDEQQDLAAVPSSFATIAASNPHARDDDPAAFILRSREGEATARVRVIPGEIAVGSTRKRVFWDMDLLSKPGYRSSGAGFMLVRGAMKRIWAEDAFFASMASTDEALALYDKLKVSNLGDVPRYLWPLRTGPILDVHLPPVLPKLVAPLADGLLGLASGALQGYLWQEAAERYRAVPCVAFDAEIDEAARRSCPSAWGWFPFDHHTLNWRLHSITVTYPRKEVDAIYFRDLQDDVMQGYAIFRSVRVDQTPGHPYRDYRVTTLIDHWSAESSPQLQAALLRATVDVARRRDADIIEIITTDRALQRQLERALFKRLGGYSFSVMAPKGFGEPIPSHLSDWRLTMAAGDGFLF
jgi:hypothetical protein